MREYRRKGLRVEFNGVAFYRYPESPVRTHRVYYTPGIADRQRGVQALHQEVWKAAHGPIPDGHDIHHSDHDPENNALENLVCLSIAEHRGGHARERGRSEQQLRHLERIRPLAVEWHRSEEGRLWHSENGRRAWERRESVERTCAYCGRRYECQTNRATDRFCSNRCTAAERRRSGVDDEVRICALCGTEFRANRYKGTKTCSRACGGRLGSRTRTGLQPDGR